MEWSKANIEKLLREQTEAAGGYLSRLGGDCWAAMIDSKPFFAVALKESTAKERLWVGNPDPLMAFLHREEKNKEWIRKRSQILLVHIPKNVLLSIPYSDVLSDFSDRYKATGKLRLDFDVINTGWRRYEIVTGPLMPNKTIRVIDDLNELIDLLMEPQNAVIF